MLAVMGVDIHLAPNWTFFVQIAVFLSVVAILNFLVFKPLLRILDWRKRFTHEAREEAGYLHSQADMIEAEASTEISDEIRKANTTGERKIAQRRGEAEGIVANAHNEARRIIDDAESSMKSSTASIVTDMDQRARSLADEIASRMLGKRDCISQK